MTGTVETLRDTSIDPQSQRRGVVGSKFYAAVQKRRKVEAHLQPASSILAFLRSGKASHPDETDSRQEYDAMIRTMQTGKGVGKALNIARSHLSAHQRALKPSERNTIHDPYPGAPEKNQRTVSGFIRVVAALKKLAPYERLALPTK